MIKPELWGLEIARSLEVLSDIPAARSAWLTKNGAPNGEFEEQINILFDDFQFKFFAKECSLAFSSDERIRIKELEIRLSDFLEETPKVISDFSFLEEKDWEYIAKEAEQIAAIIRKKL